MSCLGFLGGLLLMACRNPVSMTRLGVVVVFLDPNCGTNCGTNKCASLRLPTSGLVTCQFWERRFAEVCSRHFGKCCRVKYISQLHSSEVEAADYDGCAYIAR